MFNSKVFLAEFIGTFALTFIGVAAGMSGAGLVAVALAHGFTLAVFAYAYGHISGTHVNPAVTFGLALNGTVKWSEAVVYWIAQFAGATVAAFILYSISGDISAGATVGSLTTTQAMQTGGMKIVLFAALIEALLTFFLMNTILHTAVAGNGGKFAGWAIGTTLAFAILAGGPLTGASLNPARTFGPAIFSAPSFANVYTYVIYLFGPLIGATLAVIVYNFFNETPEVVEEQVVIEVVDAPAVKVRKPVARKTTAKK
ncbi:MAG: aquaporin [Anaerolineales bacterium]